MSDRTPKMRLYHRYLGYFLAGIMTMYALSGITLIFRDTNFLKREKLVERTLPPNLKNEELGREIRQRELKIEKEEGDVVTFRQGSYNRATGVVKYTVKELPYFVDKMTHLHKADTKHPLFFLNIFFGLSLLFFVVSSFWMFLPNTTVFKKGLYFAIGGAVLTLILILI
jgi:hypothetical protein